MSVLALFIAFFIGVLAGLFTSLLFMKKMINKELGNNQPKTYGPGPKH